MSLIVQKFGGTSVADAQRIMHVARIVTQTRAAGHDVVVVVSAQGHTTDELIAKADEINPKATKRERDVLLSAGEQISMALLAMAIEKLGFTCKSLTGWQAGYRTSSAHGNSRIRSIDKDRLHNELDNGCIIVIAGFQGINRYDDITTLGRGGSDITAVAAAAVLGADLCQIYTDVDGVYTADPHIVEDAVKLDEISYDEMLELASLGAQVLQNRSVVMAKKYHVKLEVLSSLADKPGTQIKEVVNVEKMLISGVARDNNVARISIVAVPDQPGVAYRIFAALAAKKINVDIILQSVGRENTKDISFTVAQDRMEEAVEIMEGLKTNLRAQEVIADNRVSKVSVVGAGMADNAGVAATMFDALAEANINIQMISTSEIKISVLIDIEDAEKAVKAIHEKFVSQIS